MLVDKHETGGDQGEIGKKASKLDDPRRVSSFVRPRAPGFFAGVEKKPQTVINMGKTLSESSEL